MNRMKELRKEKKMTQRELGEIINLSHRTISAYEKGDRDPDTESLNKLADFFGVSIDYLLGRTYKRKPDGSITAYHLDTDGLTDEELEAIENMIEFYKQKHKK